jgi:hypothetical protein
MCLRRAPEKYIAGAALDTAGLDNVVSSTSRICIGLHGLLGDSFTYFTCSAQNNAHLIISNRGECDCRVDRLLCCARPDDSLANGQTV